MQFLLHLHLLKRHTMNIWEAYCTPSYYNIYFEFLKAKGMKPEEAEALKGQYKAYLQRIKEVRFASDLKKITTKEDFLEKLKEIFYIKWQGKVKYQAMPHHYERYLAFLDTMQALHNDFINDDEKRRLINPNYDIPIAELTAYEKEYMVDGKLVAIANPLLISILKEYVESRGMAPDRLTIICKDFYEGHFPTMNADDYAKLIKMLWSPARQVRRGGGNNKIQITFPDGHAEQHTIFDAALQVINFYGFDECLKFKPQMRSEPFLVKFIPYSKEKIYKEIADAQYMRIDGNYKDYLNILRLINIHFGNKLKIELC